MQQQDADIVAPGEVCCVHEEFGAGKVADESSTPKGQNKRSREM